MLIVLSPDFPSRHEDANNKLNALVAAPEPLLLVSGPQVGAKRRKRHVEMGRYLLVFAAVDHPGRDFSFRIRQAKFLRDGGPGSRIER